MIKGTKKAVRLGKIVLVCFVFLIPVLANKEQSWGSFNKNSFVVQNKCSDFWKCQSLLFNGFQVKVSLPILGCQDVCFPNWIATSNFVENVFKWSCGSCIPKAVDSIFEEAAVLPPMFNDEATNVTSQSKDGTPFLLNYNATLLDGNMISLAEVAESILNVTCDNVDDQNATVQIVLEDDFSFAEVTSVFPLSSLLIVRSSEFGECSLHGENGVGVLPPASETDPIVLDDGFLTIKKVSFVNFNTVLIEGIPRDFLSMFDSIFFEASLISNSTNSSSDLSTQNARFLTDPLNPGAGLEVNINAELGETKPWFVKLGILGKVFGCMDKLKFSYSLTSGSIDVSMQITYGSLFEFKGEIGGGLEAFSDDYTHMIHRQAIPPYGFELPGLFERFFRIPEIRAGVFVEIPFRFNYTATADVKVEGKYTFSTETNTVLFGFRGNIRDLVLEFYSENNIETPESNGDATREETTQTGSLAPKGVGFNFDIRAEIGIELVAYLFGLGEGRLSMKAALESKSRLQLAPFFGPIKTPELLPLVYGACSECHSAEVPLMLIFEGFNFSYKIKFWFLDEVLYNPEGTGIFGLTRLIVTMPLVLMCLPTPPVPENLEPVECGNQCCTPPSRCVQEFEGVTLVQTCKLLPSLMDAQPRTIEVGVPRDVTVSVEARATTAKQPDEIDYFSIKRLDSEGFILGTYTNYPLEPKGNGIFSNTLPLLSVYTNEVFNFAAIPVIDGIENITSIYVGVFMNAVTSICLSPPIFCPTLNPPTISPTNQIALPSATPTFTPVPTLTPTTSSDNTYDVDLSFLWNQVGEDFIVDQFPQNVKISSDGQIVAMSEPFLGKISVNRYNGSQWNPYGTPITQIDYERFGSAMDLSGDGQYIAATDTDGFDSFEAVKVGKAMVFQYVNSTWVPIGNEIIGTNVTIADDVTILGANVYLFGRYTENLAMSIAISDDGSVVAVGGDRGGDLWDNSNYKRYGLARVFMLESDVWIQRGTDNDLSSVFDAQVSALKGCKISLSGDGSILGVLCGIGGDVRLFEWNTENWNQIGQTLSFPDFELEDIDLSNDGSTVAISFLTSRSPVEVYRYADNFWEQLGRTIRADEEGERFISMQLNANGNVVCIGHPSAGEFGFNAGKIRVFEFVESDWIRIGPSITGARWSFGSDCAISGDGNTIASKGVESTMLIASYEVVQVYQKVLNDNLPT